VTVATETGAGAAITGATMTGAGLATTAAGTAVVAATGFSAAFVATGALATT